MREEYAGFPGFNGPYRLGDCAVQDCGCIMETRPDGQMMQWVCPEHTKKI